MSVLMHTKSQTFAAYLLLGLLPWYQVVAMRIQVQRTNATNDDASGADAIGASEAFAGFSNEGVQAPPCAKDWHGCRSYFNCKSRSTQSTCPSTCHAEVGCTPRCKADDSYRRRRFNIANDCNRGCSDESEKLTCQTTCQAEVGCYLPTTTTTTTTHPFVYGENGGDTCPSGSVPIQTAEDCQEASEVLGVTFNGVSTPAFTGRLPYCWLGFKGKSNFNPAGDSGGGDRMQNSKTICTKAAISQIIERPVIYGEYGDDACPFGSVPIQTEKDCQHASEVLGITFRGVSGPSWGNRLPYCWLGRQLQSNFNPTGDSGVGDQMQASRTICKVFSQLFNYTGRPQFFTVPDKFSEVKITVAGACGGPANNGYRAAKGGIMEGILPVSPGQVLRVYVGGAGGTPGGGWNGGGKGDGRNSGGGGATDVRLTDSLDSRVIVGGGGGGSPFNGGSGGAGGGEQGGTAKSSWGTCPPGGGQTINSQLQSGMKGGGYGSGANCGSWGCSGGGGGFVGGSIHDDTWGGTTCKAGGGGSGYIGGVKEGKFVGHTICDDEPGNPAAGDPTGKAGKVNAYAIISFSQ